MSRKNVLFVHNNFPGQLGFIAQALKARGDRCVAIGSETARSADIPVRNWKLPRGTGKDVFPLAVRAEADLIRGRAAAQVALDIRAKGFIPDLIVAHPGWGETLLLAEIFPKARQVLHGEFYYRSEGGDVGFDPEFGAMTDDERFRIAAKNATMSLAYVQADAIVAPTPFQASVFPSVLRDRMRIIHEGVDTVRVRPRENVKLKIKDGPTLDRSTPVITFINRNFEPLRGFHVFMRALPKLLAEARQAHVVLIGDHGGKGYGASAGEQATWHARMLAEVGDKLDMSRVHFVGRVPYDWMLDAMAVSAGHVYYTYPFVLSWSCLEAMASECLVIGSDTAPVRDAITNGENGILLDFFDVDALSNAMIEACRKPEAFQDLRRAARRTVLEKFDRASLCLPRWLATIDSVMGA